MGTAGRRSLTCLPGAPSGQLNVRRLLTACVRAGSLPHSYRGWGVAELRGCLKATWAPPLNDPGSFGDPGLAIDVHLTVPPHEEVATAGSKSNTSRAGPFPGPKPEPMTVPRGARRSNRRAHPSRLGQARRFLPSWSCEFDSRHPLQSKAPSQLKFQSCRSYSNVRMTRITRLVMCSHDHQRAMYRTALSGSTFGVRNQAC
jgi:hypothetical protein